MTIPDLTGQTVTSVSYVGALYLDTREEWQITIESDFTVSDGGRQLSKSAGDLDTIVGLAGQQVGQPVTAFGISDTGTLEFTVGSLSVRVDPSPKYEAWNLAGPDKQLVVCMPGGELAIWS